MTRQIRHSWTQNKGRDVAVVVYFGATRTRHTSPTYMAALRQMEAQNPHILVEVRDAL